MTERNKKMQKKKKKTMTEKCVGKQFFRKKQIFQMKALKKMDTEPLVITARNELVNMAI